MKFTTNFQNILKTVVSFDSIKHCIKKQAASKMYGWLGILFVLLGWHCFLIENVFALNDLVTKSGTENIEVHFYSEVISVHDILNIWVKIPYEEWENTFEISDPSPERAHWLYDQLLKASLGIEPHGNTMLHEIWHAGAIYAHMKAFPKTPKLDPNLYEDQYQYLMSKIEAQKANDAKVIEYVNHKYREVSYDKDYMKYLLDSELLDATVLSKPEHSDLIENFIRTNLFKDPKYALALIKNPYIMIRVEQLNLYDKYIYQLLHLNIISSNYEYRFVKKLEELNLLDIVIQYEFPGTVVNLYAEGVISKESALKCGSLLPVHLYAINQKVKLEDLSKPRPTKPITQTNLTHEVTDMTGLMAPNLALPFVLPFTLLIDVGTALMQPIMDVVVGFSYVRDDLLSKDKIIYSDEFNSVFYFKYLKYTEPMKLQD